MVTDNADIPTIFEYVLGILWYKTSERHGKILDYMKLSLDADLLPKTHAAGGEADIVYEYGPNGTGKTSLAKVFSGKEGTAISCEYDSHVYEDVKELFHVINDQNNRNIISGTAKDFLLGDNIRKEFELQQFTSEKYQVVLLKVISQLKDTFKISTVSNPLITSVENSKLSAIVKDLANKNSKGSKTAIKEFLDL